MESRDYFVYAPSVYTFDAFFNIYPVELGGVVLRQYAGIMEKAPSDLRFLPDYSESSRNSVAERFQSIESSGKSYPAMILVPPPSVEFENRGADVPANLCRSTMLCLQVAALHCRNECDKGVVWRWDSRSVGEQRFESEGLPTEVSLDRLTRLF